MTGHEPTIEGGAVPLPGDGLVVVVTPTVMDGTVVRWYPSIGAAQYGREIASASRNGVLVNGYLHEVAGILDTLHDTHRRLAADPRADVSNLATHRAEKMFGPLVKIERP